MKSLTSISVSHFPLTKSFHSGLICVFLLDSLQPYGGINMAKAALTTNGYQIDPEVEEFFTTHRKTHNAGIC